MKVGDTPLAQSAGKNFFLCPFTFLALQIKLVVFVSAFEVVNTVWSVSLSCSSTHGAPPCPAICKSGGHVPPYPMELAPLEVN